MIHLDAAVTAATTFLKRWAPEMIKYGTKEWNADAGESNVIAPIDRSHRDVESVREKLELSFRAVEEALRTLEVRYFVPSCLMIRVLKFLTLS